MSGLTHLSNQRQKRSCVVWVNFCCCFFVLFTFRNHGACVCACVCVTLVSLRLCETYQGELGKSQYGMKQETAEVWIVFTIREKLSVF